MYDSVTHVFHTEDAVTHGYTQLHTYDSVTHVLHPEDMDTHVLHTCSTQRMWLHAVTHTSHMYDGVAHVFYAEDVVTRGYTHVTHV